MKHTKILLVDDDDDDQFLFKDAVKQVAPGTECASAYNGIEALRYLKSASPRPSLIFLDLNMPLMNGFECLEHLKVDARLSAIPVIIFTTSSNHADKKRAEELGAAMFFTKTFSFKLLKDSLRDILNMDFSRPATR